MLKRYELRAIPARPKSNAPICSWAAGVRTLSVIEARTAHADEGAPTLSASVDITREELQLAARNHGMPLEALRYDVTPVGLHYLLTHYDIPAVDSSIWRLRVGGRV